ncbi:MAG TPA: 50S ribosomal protein L22 [Phycisphaerae bacterium]|nr:50S ribosomal protein L22 [Phycisphaerae bacterium]HUU22482.1 50S ribosomal protein L22 [Phycisphaerae bacterium]
MAWKAVHRYARISPTKVRPVVDMIRGRDVNDAMNILQFTPNRAAAMVRKALASAMANADEAEADVELLFVNEAFVDEAPKIKRWRPKDRGRAFPIRKRNSHITIVVEEGHE